ncbi:MAG: MFS transporter, partial [Armatimonadota bacterium]|nr:MFS transporter [Armatimonadota bacterium]
ATPVQLGLVVVAWGLAFSLCAPFGGRAADRFGCRTTLLVGALLYALAAALCAAATAPVHLGVISLLGGLGCALFWPSFEILLHSPNRAETQRRLGLFNVGWALGLMSGSAAAGYAYRLAGPHRAFWGVSILVVTVALMVAATVRHSSGTEAHADETLILSPSPVAPEGNGGYLWMAWAANFGVFFATSSAAAIFPKLARTLAIGDGHIGILLAVVMGAQTLVFVVLARTDRWHDRTLPLIAGPAVGVIGLLAVAAGSATAVFATGLALLGLARGMTCSASLHYSIHRPGARGASMGIHESIIGSAFVAGPLMGGWIAQSLSLRASFVMSAAVVSLAGAVILAIRWRFNAASQQERVEQPLSA